MRVKMNKVRTMLNALADKGYSVFEGFRPCKLAKGFR